jgi:hypothetical protein
MRAPALAAGVIQHSAQHGEKAYKAARRGDQDEPPVGAFKKLFAVLSGQWLNGGE